MLPLREPHFTPEGIYLDTATYGLAANTVVASLRTALDRWRRGVATMEEYDEAVSRSRELIATIVGCDVDRIAAANQVSTFVGMIAASLPDGTRVVAPEGDFTSLLFPLAVHRDRGVTLRTVPLDALADSIDQAPVDLVAFSLVQSADGRLADVDAIEAAAHRQGARLLVDATQAVGWLPFDVGRFDWTVFSAYKWLLCPRGTAFMVVNAATQELRPILAGWYAGEEPWGSIYGMPLRLAGSARRYDVSPAWFSWVGSVPALEIIADAGVASIHRHDVGLARMVRDRLGLSPSGSAMAVVPVRDTELLAAHGIRAARRAGAVRVGFHLYNDVSDVDALVSVITAEAHAQRP